MADEFAKGFGILMTAGLGWLVIAGWFNTPGFEEQQLLAPNPECVDIYCEAALLLKEGLLWFAILGALTFWVVVPAIDEVREAWSGRGE